MFQQRQLHSARSHLLLECTNIHECIRFDIPFWEQCRASLCFSNHNFPPITFAFDSSDCVGPEVASFVVPDGVPNGDALVIWYGGSDFSYTAKG